MNLFDPHLSQAMHCSSIRIENCHAMRDPSAEAGRWLVSKYHAQAAQHGTYKAALNMKKQGVPVELAALVLATRGAA